MSKETLFHYLQTLNSKYDHDTDVSSLRIKRIIELICAEGVLDHEPDAADTMAAKDAANMLLKGRFFSNIGMRKEDVINAHLAFKLSKEQVSKLIEISNRKIVCIRPIKTDPTSPETYHEYEEYLRKTYAAVGITPPDMTITDGTNSINIRERYPHEVDDSSDKLEIIYVPDNKETRSKTKNYYLSFFENQIASLSFVTTLKNKDEFLNLLHGLKDRTAYNIKNISDPSIIDTIIAELENDKTSQATEIGYTKIEIPGTYIAGCQSNKYRIILNDTTYQKIKDKLNTIFGNAAGNNISVVKTPANTITLDKIKRRNSRIVEDVKDILKQYESKQAIETTGADIRILAELKKLLKMVDFNPADYRSADEFTELVGGYVPTSRLDDLYKCVHELADKDFDFERFFPNFVPIPYPKHYPTDSKTENIPDIEAYERRLRKLYRNYNPSLFHTDEYNFKKGRKMYPHEVFEWKNDDPSIDATDNSNEHTDYYKKVYQDYVHYREHDRPVKEIKRAPSKLLLKFFNSNELTKTLYDIGKAIKADGRRRGPDGTHITEGRNRMYAFLEKLRITSIVSGAGLIVKGIIAGFGSVSLGPAILAAGGGAIAWQLISKIRRIYIGYQEIMENRVSVTLSQKGLQAAEPYKKLIEDLDPVKDAEKIRRNKEIVKAYIAYYIANYRKFMRSYDRLKRSLKDDYADDRAKLMSEKEDYMNNLFAEYWKAGESLVPEYTDLNKDEFETKIEAIKNGRRRY